MDNSGTGKSPNTSLSFRYNANNEELEELCDAFEDDPPTPVDASPIMRSENASPKKGDKTPSILDKYFKSMRAADKLVSDKEEKEKLEKSGESKVLDDSRSTPKEVSSSPVKDYLKNFGKKSVSEPAEVKDVGSNETWKLFHDFKYKIAQAVEEMKTRSLEETKEKEKSMPRDNSISDSEENSVIKDSDQSVGDTDNQVSSLNSSMQNLSEMTHPLTARATEPDLSLPYDKNFSDASDDTQKNLVQSEKAHETENSNEPNLLDVESGVEALEDGIDGFSDAQHIHFQIEQNAVGERPRVTLPTTPPPPNIGHLPRQIDNQQRKIKERKPIPFFTLTLYFLTIVVLVNIVLFPEYRSWNGFVMGIWVFYFLSQVKEWVLANYFGEWEPSARSAYQLNRNVATPISYTIPSVKEYRPIKKYEGWVNHYRCAEYDPMVYSVNKTITAFMKLEGCNLRISYTKTKIPKRALWDEKPHKVEFYMHRLYNLTGAKVMLLPKGLVRRRQWSKKYPICIVLNENENIQVLEKENVTFERKAAEAHEKKKDQQQEMETAETNTSPEKKKKFVWRRKDKSNVGVALVTTHAESEPSREGLRHRLVRKKHRDKKSDSPSTAADYIECSEKCQSEKTLPEEPTFHDAETDLNTKSNTSQKDETEEDVDEELNLIKEVLAETELDATAVDGANEGEWSVHTKHYKESHQLYLFTRTGRDKHEWFRRLKIAVEDAEIQSAENSGAEEKSGTEQSQESKDGIEMAVYKVAEKENVAFAYLRGRKSVILTEGGVEGPAYESCEKTFWPFLLKILETHELSNKTRSEVAIMCQLEPTPRKGSRSKKKSKEQKQHVDTCDCRMLPSEVMWLNAVLARIIYDMIHNDDILRRIQTRIQRKLHTLKLPSFMSPLVVTDLSLAGACPLVETVCAPTWDERGVWLDADLRYDGGAYISVLTQINLMKLKEKNMTLEDQLLQAHKTLDNEVTESNVSFDESFVRRRKPAVYDSDVEDSAESSEDDSPPIQAVDSNDNVPPPSDHLTQSSSEMGAAPGSSKKKFLRMVDKIATNKYFQQVTDYKYVKRAMEGLSNMDIKLQIEVQGLEGRLAINLPPPPHDRVWIGFRTNPQLVLKAKPAVGARSVRFAQITNWIEHRLRKEFEKFLVLPNMEDLIIDLMTATPIYDD